MISSSSATTLTDIPSTDSRLYGTLLCDSILNEHQLLIDLAIRWADAQALRLFSFDPSLLRSSGLLSACLGPNILNICQQLVSRQSATLTHPLPNGSWVQFRLTAIDTGYVALLEEIQEPPMAGSPESGGWSTDGASRRSELFLRIPDHLPGGVIVWEPIRERGLVTDFRFVLMNRAIAAISGKNPADFAGQSLLTLFPDVSGSDFFDRLLAVISDGQPQSFEYQYHWQGQMTWLALSAAKVSDNVLIHCQDISKTKRIEADMVRRLELESLISAVSSRLINLSDAELDACILDALQQIGTYNQADRVYISAYSEDQQFMTCLYEWCAPGVDPQQANLQNRPVDSFSWWQKVTGNDQIISIKSVDELPPEAAEVKAGLRAQGVLSILSLPLRFSPHRQGRIGFTTVRQERQWAANDITLLMTFAELIVSALKRQQNEDAVRRTYQRLRGLHTIDKALLQSSFTDELPAVTALRHINDLIPCERMLVFRIDHATGLAHAEGRLLNGWVDVQPDVVVPAQVFHSPSLLAGQTINITELTPDNPWVPSSLNLHGRGFRSLVIIPLFSQDQFIGAFLLLAKVPFFFTDEYLQVAREVANQLAIALYQQQLRDQVRQNTELLEQRVQERTAEISQLSALQNAILEHAGLAILSTDATGLVQTANPATEKLLGYTADELVGRVYPALLPDSDEPDAAANMLSFQYTTPSRSQPGDNKRNWEIQDSNHAECVVLSKDGRLIPVLLASSALRDASGQISGYVGMATDIAALKEARSALQQKHQELETFFDGSLDLHAITGATGALLKINRSWEATLGYTTAEIVSQPFINWVHPDDRADTTAVLTRVLDRLPVEKMVNRIRKKDGGYCTFEWNVVAHGQLVYASARDITEQRAAEEQLRVASQRLQLALRAARQGIWELDLTNYTLFWDERQHEMHGTSAATFGGHMSDFLALVHPDDLDAIQNLSARFSNADEPVGAEKRIIRADNGQTRYLETHSRLVTGADGQPQKMVGVSWDVTKRKETELNLQESEERYRSLVNNSKDVVFQTDLTGAWTFLNPAWEEVTGYTIEESLGQPFNELVDADLHPMTQQLFRDLIDFRKTSFPYVIQYRHKNGSYRWAELMTHVTLDDDSRPTGVSGTITDITEQKHALDALRESEQRFREFADVVDEVFWIHAADPFRLLYVNPAYERVWGRSCQSLYDDALSFFDSVLDEDKPIVISTFGNYSKGESGSTQYRLRGDGGVIKWVSVRTFVTNDADGAPLRYIGIASDITSLKEKELVLQQSLQREQELNRLKSQFVTTASHEFRTPLSTILSSVDLIKLYVERPDALAGPAVKRHLNIIEKEINNFSELLSDILTIGRIDAGKINFSPRQTDIEALVRDVIATHFTNPHDSRMIDLQVEGLPQPVYIDDKLMTHVLVNMLSNAFKFSRSNPELRITFRERRFCLTITDEGIGIPADDLPHLFETFFRARNAISVPGSGLGLMITRQFIELHGGTIRVCSEENQGTTFTITLPVDARQQEML